MRPSRCLVIVWLALAGMSVWISAQQRVFRSGVDLVCFGVTVVDRKGGLVTTLSERDFEVYEDGQRQQIRLFVPGSTAEGAEEGPAPELHLGVLFDASGSMEADVRLAQTAVIRFLNTLQEAADITLVDFDTEVRVARFVQADFPRLVERVRTRKPDGYTALYDALGVYLHTAFEQHGRKILVLYSDGADNQSNITFDEVRALLRASDVTVYTIGFLEHLPTSMRFDMRMRLQQLAEISGGQFFNPMSIDEMTAIYEKVKAEIRAQYSLGYVSSNPTADGAWRKVEIKLVGPELKSLKVRTRKGYYAPRQVAIR